MSDVFCPVCNGSIVVRPVTIVTVSRHPHAGHALDIKYDLAAVCPGCSLVSEVQADRLIDLGALSLDDLEAPFVAGMTERRVLLQSGSTLLWDRRDS